MLVGITLGKRWFWTQAADDSVSTVSHPFYFKLLANYKVSA